MADVFAPQPVKTKTAGDVVVNINTGQTIGISTGSAIIGAVTIAPAQVIGLSTGANTIGAVNITSGQTIGLSAGTAIIGTLTDNQSVNISQLNGVAVTVGSGASSIGTQRVILATDQTPIPVSEGLLFTTQDSGLLTSASLAAGASIELDGTQITSGTGMLYEATVSSSVALKAQLGTWDGTTFVVKRTFFVQANESLLYEPSRYDAIKLATGTTANFRWLITNNDNVLAADVYASITYAN